MFLFGFYFLPLLFLLLVRSPPLPLPSLQYPAQYDAAHSDDMNDEVDGCPVVDGVRGFQQHKAHAHVVVGPHLQEPVNPVEDILSLRTQFGPDGGLHGRLSRNAQWDCEEGQIVASMESVPVGTDEHGPASPEGTQEECDWFHVKLR